MFNIKFKQKLDIKKFKDLFAIKLIYIISSILID